MSIGFVDLFGYLCFLVSCVCIARLWLDLGLLGLFGLIGFGFEELVFLLSLLWFVRLDCVC